MVDLYRAVDADELADIAQNGFRAGPGIEAKQFGLQLDEVLDFTTDPGTRASYYAAVTVRVPRSALNEVDFSRSIDPWHFKSGVVTVPEQGLPGLNSEPKEVSVLPIADSFVARVTFLTPAEGASASSVESCDEPVGATERQTVMPCGGARRLGKPVMCDPTHIRRPLPCSRRG